MNNNNKHSQSISLRSFLTAISVIAALMVFSYALTFMIPGGEYQRITDPMGNTLIDTESGFSTVDGGIPFWKWLLSPILVLGSNGNGTLIAVIVFLLVIGGVFNALNQSGLISYILYMTVSRFSAVRYQLMAAISLFFMALGSLIGSFEECVPLVPLTVALALKLGWDPLTGIGMSLLAAGCGFAAGVCNPFTVGVAQQLAGLPMFSGIWMRLLSFVLIYTVLLLFLYTHAKKIDRSVTTGHGDVAFQRNDKSDRGMTAFISILGTGIGAVLMSAFFPALQDYTMIIVAVMFLAAGVTSVLLCGIGFKTMIRTFWEGIAGIFPAVVMILMASSIKYTLEEAHIMDTILHTAVELAHSMSGWMVILFIYLIVLVMNFFIPSGSAKAFMLIPLIIPMAQIFGISPQLCIVAFAFGDGFSNVFYPTNPALLIALGLADVSYGAWFKWSVKFQLLNLVLTCIILIFGYAVGY